jgi:hypothetical protein
MMILHPDVCTAQVNFPEPIRQSRSRAGASSRRRKQARLIEEGWASDSHTSGTKMAGMHLILSSQLSFASFHLQAIFFPSLQSPYF